MYLLALIGRNSVATDKIETQDIFSYNNELFIKLIDIDFKQCLRDIQLLPELKIMTKTNHYEPHIHYLAIFFNPINENVYEYENVSSRSITARKRLFYQFLQKSNGEPLREEIDENNVPVQNVTIEYYNIESSLRNLFEKLKNAHNSLRKNFDHCPIDDIQHEYLTPQLRPYQENAVRWMINRELKTDYIPSEFIEVSTISEYISIDQNTALKQILYFNPRTLQLVDINPLDIKIPTGGILADEMGLGKTVEVLALILLNKKKKRKYNELIDETQISSQQKHVENRKEKIVCICNHKTQNTISKQLLIKCTKCHKFQHKKCVLKFVDKFNYSNDDNFISKTFICPSCWRYEPIIESSATIIVSPVVIKQQWQTEIEKHISNKNFKVFVYNGVTATGWINPIDLSNYDVILTDYNVLKSEIHFTNLNERTNLRNEKQFLNPISPLPLIRYWRVCLDESQMVETPKNACSTMAKLLPTVHRWAVTGTPIEKDINNLYGLFFFLNFYPYNDYKKWLELSNEYSHGNADALIDVLCKVMWRTCKHDVLDQVNIPDQKTIVHYVTMTDVETFFNHMQHEKYSKIFELKSMKIKNDLAMSKMGPRTLKLLMEPLRKIRQDCTAPSIFQRYNSNSTTVKKILKPAELLEHLVTNNEIDCKSALRSIISCLNGIAGIHIINKEYDKAISIYKDVIRRANEKKIYEKITVDSLQQIHANFNLIDIIEEQHLENNANLEELKENCAKLEWKYIDGYYSNIKQCELQLTSTQISLNELKTKLNNENLDEYWLTDLIDQIDQNNIDFVSKIKVELNQLGQNKFNNEISSAYGLKYVLLPWWDQLITARQENITHFNKLHYFTKNIKPKNLLEKKESKKIDFLLKSALECHLLNNKLKNKKNKIICEICKLKKTLMKYECLIFDKSFREDAETEGTWHPTHQEWIIKTIVNCFKKENSYKTSEKYLELIELLKKEYKEYTKLWVEIDYTVSAYDELNMCKSRLKSIDPFLMTPEDKDNKYLISIYDIETTKIEFQEQLKESELNFVKFLGRLKYLKHLERKTEPDICPICTEKLEQKYTVLQCGHIMCFICLNQMIAFQKTHITCCVCRNKQSHKEIFFVTCKTESDNITFKGEYSSKIEKIIKTIIQLKLEDNCVKILIFSQWDKILKILSYALIENNINHRLKSAKIHKCIDEFKNPALNVTCLLLPLQLGSKGLNLIEATHVFLVEPILNPGEELQAIGRVHRIGQTKLTYVHKFIVSNSIEETIYDTISNDLSGKWRSKCVTIQNLQNLFLLNK